MKMKHFLPITALIACMLLPVISEGAARNEIILPKPRVSGGLPLLTALAKRQSSRSFSRQALPDQVLSDLLWAANGINRKSSGKRTAPSAVNRQEIEIYIALREGLYLYDEGKHSLQLTAPGDLRGLTGSQGFVRDAALNLVYVADMSRVAGNSAEDRLIYAAADTGFIGQNVYLFCASEGLATVIRGYVDRQTLAKAIGLKPNKRIILAQTVGYPIK